MTRECRRSDFNRCRSTCFLPLLFHFLSFFLSRILLSPLFLPLKYASFRFLWISLDLLHSRFIQIIYIYFVRRNYTKILSRFIVSSSKWVETRKGNLQEQEKNLVSVSLFGNRGIFLRIELGSTSYVREPLNLFTGRVDFYLDLRLSLRHRIEYKSRITITQ